MTEFPFVGGAYLSRSTNFDAQRCVNLHPVLSESGSSASVAMLTTTPGHRHWLTVGDGPIRGLCRIDALTLLVVSGRKLWRVTPGRVATEIGGIDGAGPARMASNGQQVMLVAGKAGYFVDLKTWALTRIADDSFAGVDAVDFIDGYFVWNRPGSGEFAISQLYGTKIDALNYATAEGAPDGLVSLIVDHRELWLFGKSTTEVWFNSGDPDFPLSRISNAFVEHGCAAAGSVAKLDNTVFWLGADERGQGILWRANGYTPQRVSTFPLESAWGRYDRIDDAQAFAYQQGGHSFYLISFPSADATWVYDVSANLWHERAWRHPVANTMHRVRGQVHAHFAGQHLVGDHESGRLYVLDLEHYRDDTQDGEGDPIARIRVAPYLSGDGARKRLHALEIVMEMGVGLVSGQGEEPKAMLQWSDDGGHSWSHEHWVDMGRIGERGRRALWRRLGAARSRALRLTITDPVPVSIIKARLEAS